jgi:hypothetical protein
MNVLRKFLRRFWVKDSERLEKEVSDLKELLKRYREKEKIEKYANYIQIKAPRTKGDVDALNFYLEGLGKDDQFLFFINNHENIIMDEFRTGKEHPELYRGGLRILKRIRDDIRDSGSRKKDDAKQAV